MNCEQIRAQIQLKQAENVVLAAAVVVDEAAVQTANGAVAAAFQQLGAANTKLSNDQQAITRNNSTIQMLTMMLQMSGC